MDDIELVRAWENSEITSTELVARILDDVLPDGSGVDIDQLARRIINALNY